MGRTQGRPGHEEGRGGHQQDGQGPVGDDSNYSLLGVYVQDEVTHGDAETTFGLRWTRAAADADSVDNPNVGGSDPTTPGETREKAETTAGR